MNPEILNRCLKLIEEVYDESMYGENDIYRIKDLIHSVDKNHWKSKQWLVDEFYNKNPDRIEMTRSEKKQTPIKFPEVVVHSHNPVGSGNITGYLNNFLMNEGQKQTCVRVEIEHTV